MLKQPCEIFSVSGMSNKVKQQQQQQQQQYSKLIMKVPPKKFT